MLKRPMVAMIRFYQRFLSPLKRAPTCRFMPTCSSYALEAIERRGVFIGSLKAFWRVLRCNPLVPGGYDPVEPLREPAECAALSPNPAESPGRSSAEENGEPGLPGHSILGRNSVSN